MKVGIIVAMASEAKVLKNQTSRLLDEIPFAVNIAGPGIEHAKKATEQLLSDGCDFFISWGVSGGLNTSLESGTLVISREVASPSEQTVQFTDDLGEKISNQLMTLNPHLGRIVSTKKPVISLTEKSKLRAVSQADAVDMESIAIAKIAKKNNCGFLSIRSIVDSANFEIPSSALAGMDSVGYLVILKVIRRLACRPKELKDLIRLSFHFLKALKTLRSVANLLIK